MVNTSKKEDERSPVIRWEPTAAFGAKPAASAQPMSASPGFILLPVLLQYSALLIVWIGCVAANNTLNVRNMSCNDKYAECANQQV